MKKRNTTLKITALVIVAAIAAVWTIATANRADAVIAIIKTTGVFSLARGQVTSAHVFNTVEDPDTIYTTWWAFDSEGRVLAQSERRAVEPGHAAMYELGPIDLDEGERMPLRFELRVEGGSRSRTSFIATQEVYNVGDGKTTVFLPYIEQ